jgi:hypothetical protein
VPTLRRKGRLMAEVAALDSNDTERLETRP